MNWFERFVATAGRVLERWMEFSGLSLQLIFVGPFLIGLFVVAFTAPLIAIWYAWRFYREPFAVWIVVALIVAAVVTLFFRSRDNRDLPVKRGRRIILSDEARKHAKSKLQR